MCVRVRVCVCVEGGDERREREPVVLRLTKNSFRNLTPDTSQTDFNAQYDTV